MSFPPPAPAPDGQVYAGTFAKKFYNMSAPDAAAAAEYLDLGSVDPTPATRVGVVVLLPRNGASVVVQLDRKSRQVTPGWKSSSSDFHTAATLMRMPDGKEKLALSRFFCDKAKEVEAAGNENAANKLSAIGIILGM